MADRDDNHVKNGNLEFIAAGQSVTRDQFLDPPEKPTLSKEICERYGLTYSPDTRSPKLGY